MLKLYYTTTKGEDELQPYSYRSLGGYKSDSPVMNDQFDNFFGEISEYSIANNNESQYIGLILKNEGTDKTNILLYFSRQETCYSKLYISAVSLSQDSDGKYFMENIPTIHSLPIYAEFFEAEGVDNAVSLGDLASGEMVGLWIKREILLDIISADRANVVSTDPENENRVVAVERETTDTIDIVFSYD